MASGAAAKARQVPRWEDGQEEATDRSPATLCERWEACGTNAFYWRTILVSRRGHCQLTPTYDGRYQTRLTDGLSAVRWWASSS